MNRDYSWEDQDPEELQKALEFNDPFGNIRESDGANFPVIVADFDREVDEELDVDPQEDFELEEILREGFADLLDDLEIEVVLTVKGIGRPTQTLEQIARGSGAEIIIVTAIWDEAVRKLRESVRFRNWI
jgi:hypothetical protein